MIHEVTAKTLLSSAKQPDPWFGIKYTMNLYRGCQHQCIYCDSRSECYRIENFADVLVKINAIDLLKKELPRKRVKGTIGTGAMSDPYLPLEAARRLTAQALEVIAEQQFPAHVLTKSDLVLRDRHLRAISGSMPQSALQLPRRMMNWANRSSPARRRFLDAWRPWPSWPARVCSPACC
jgi:DNA repair photolyase